MVLLCGSKLYERPSFYQLSACESRLDSRLLCHIGQPTCMQHQRKTHQTALGHISAFGERSKNPFGTVERKLTDLLRRRIQVKGHRFVFFVDFYC